MKRFSIVSMLMAAALMAACAPTPSTPSPGQAPSGTPTPAVVPTPTPSSPATPAVGEQPGTRATVKVYFDRDEHMQPVLRTAAPGDKAVLRAALTALLAGPSKSESASDLDTLIPSGTKLNSVSISGKTATIDLSSRFASGGGTLSMTNRLAQVVFTATQFPTVTGVNFRLDGKAVTVFGGEGIILDHPQTRADYEGATAAIMADDPAWLGTVRNGTVARGTANVFEATFQIQLRDSAGKLLVNKTVTATSGTGTRGTWSQKLSWASAKSGVGKLKVFSYSAKDGKPIDVVTIPVTIK